MRPHIHHLDAEMLPWEELLDSKLMRKVFSVDPDTGGDTALVRLTPGWQGRAGAHYHSGFEEALILAGDVDLNGHDSLLRGSYLYRPGGVVHGFVDRSNGGADIIIKMGAATDLNSVGNPASHEEYDHPSARVADGRPHIVNLLTETQPWTQWDGIERKILSRDAITGAETALFRVPAGFSGRQTLSAARTWEWVVLDGCITLAGGTRFSRFGYSHRPGGAGDTMIAESPQGCTMMVWMS